MSESKDNSLSSIKVIPEHVPTVVISLTGLL